MLNEIKILFKNIKNLRKPIINEAVSEKNLIDSIDQHKIIYIYYAGDDTILKGYRTIRPFVLGTHKSTGNKVLRAWQDAGSSDSYRGLNRTPRQDHEIQNGPKGKQPGWRLFRVDKITSLMPTGEKFTPRDYFTVGKISYNPNDSAMSSIDAAIQKTPEQSVKTSGLGSTEEPNVVATKVDDKGFEPQTSRFKQFFKAADRTREVTKDEVEKWYDLVKKYRKKSPRNYWVIQNEKGDMVLVTDRAVHSGDVKKESVVGNLKDLYNKFVVEPKATSKSFFDQEKEKVNREMGKR